MPNQTAIQCTGTIFRIKPEANFIGTLKIQHLIRPTLTVSLTCDETVKLQPEAQTYKQSPLNINATLHKINTESIVK